MSAREKIAYLKGLLDGLGDAENEGQGKIFKAVVDALDALSLEVAEHEELIQEQRELYEDLADDCALLDEDLDALEKAFVEFSGEEGFDGEEDEDEDDVEFDQSYVSVTCPHCSYVFYFQPEEYEPDEVLECPGCGKHFEQPKE